MTTQGTVMQRGEGPLAYRPGAAIAAGRRGPPLGLLLAGSTLLIALGEAALCGVQLATPVDPVLRDVLRLAGGLTGLAAAASLMRSRVVPARMLNRVMLWLVLPFAGLMAGEPIAARWNGLWAFAGSSAPWQDTVYPIVDLRHTVKGNRSELVIDPLNRGLSIEVPIPDPQYRVLRGSQLAGLCVTLPTRRAANGAIAVRTGAPYRFSPSDPAAVGPCTAPPDPWR